MANTSKLLNSCIDKNFIQNAVNIIQNDTIHNVSLNFLRYIEKYFILIYQYSQIQKTRLIFLLNFELVSEFLYSFD